MIPRDNVKKVLLEWNEKTLPDVIKRDVKITLEPTEIITITGVRRSGKTYLLFYLIKQLLKSLKRSEILYVNFEHELLRNIDAADVRLFFDVHKELFETKIKYIFFDEIQHVKDWQVLLRRLHDERKYRIFITGSSSELEPKQIAYSLRGRTLNYTIFPLSFNEFLRFKKYKIEKTKLLLETYKGKLLKLLKEYLVFGGFPDVVLKKDASEKKKLLSSYFDTILLRDLIDKYPIRNIRLFEDFIKYLLSISSSYFSASKTEKYFKSLGEKCTKSTFVDFLSYAKNCFLVFPVEIYSPKIRSRKQYPVKIYSVDTGFVNFINPRFTENKGPLMENIVAINLAREMENSFREIFYWKEYGTKGKEVDFIIKQGLKIKQLIQVTYASSKDEINHREISSLIKASKELKCKNLLVITWDYESEEEINRRKIKFIPLWKWLLS